MHRFACTVCIVLTAALPARAGTITIDWPVNLTFPASLIGPFETGHEIRTRIDKEISALGVTLARLELQAGMSFPTRHLESFDLSLPLRVSITAPDTARPGSSITLRPTISLSAAPSFRLNGSATFDTTIFARGEGFLPILGTERFDTGTVNLPDVVRLSGGSGITFGGSGSYAGATSAARDVLIGPFARTVPVDPRLLNVQGDRIAIASDRFAGFELSAEGRMDAWRGELNLWEPIRAVPVIGTAAAVADVLSDLDLRLGADLISRSTLSTGVLYGLFSDDNGSSFRDPVVLNNAFSDGVVARIPTTASGDYALEFNGFGLGIGLVQQALMQANLDLVLDGTDPLPSWKIASADFGGPWDLGRQYTRFSFYDFLDDAFSNPPVPVADRTLLIDILADAPPDPLPSSIDPGLPPGDPAGVGDLLPDSGRLPSTAPTGGAIEIPDVAEPSSIIALGTALLVGIWRRVRSPTRWRATAPAPGGSR